MPLNADDAAQLDRVVSLLRDVLGPDLVAAQLFGSAVLGGLRPDSDLDVLAVSRRPTAEREKRALVEQLLAISGRKGRRIELTVVVDSAIRPWRFPPRFDFHYGDWLRAEFERGELHPWPTTESGDLATLLTMTRRFGEPLVGAAPADVLEPVPAEDLRAAMVGDVDSLLEDLGPDTRNVLLTLARIWSTLATGEIRPKDDAAAWAVERLPPEHGQVLAHARAAYLGEAEERWDGLPVRLAADSVVAGIRALA